MSTKKTPRTLKKPVFTVITVTLNNLSGLKNTYESVSQQEFTNFEWLVIDGASKDGSADFLKDKKQNTDHEFILRYTSEKDAGIYDAMNKGIKHAFGEYLIFMNAGDTFASPDILKTIEKHTEKQPDFIYGDAFETTKNGGKPIAKTASQYKNMPCGMFTHHQAMIYNHQTLKAIDIHYSTLYTIASDYDFTARFLAKSKKIIYIPKPICIFEHGGISQQNAYTGRREQFLIREKLNMVSPRKNVMIFITQTIAWHLKAHAPWLYKHIKAMVNNRKKQTKSI